jgi:hypothetical protein
MRSRACLILVAVVAAGPVLSACSSVPDLDSIGEIFDTKKKLSGDRKPVFPEGVPGVSSGVPPELVRGYREPESGVADPARAAAEAIAEEPKPAQKPAPKKPPPQRTAAKPKPKPPAQTQAQAPATQPQQPPAQATWPAPQPQAAWPTTR